MAKPSDPPAARGKRGARRLWPALPAFGLALTVSFGAGAQTGLLEWLGNGINKAVLPTLLSQLGGAIGYDIEVGEAEGPSPFDVTLRDVRISDDQGPFLEADRLHLEWKFPWPNGGVLDIFDLSGDRVALSRLPGTAKPAEPPPEPQPADQGGFALPQLPFDINLEKLNIGELVLAEPVVGEAATIAIAGNGRLDDNGAEARLTVERKDEPGRIATEFAYRPAENRLVLEFQASEPEGGVMARAAGIPGLPPVALSVDGEGPLDDWRAKVSGNAGEADLAGDIRIEGPPTARILNADLAGDIAPLLPEPYRPLVGEAVRFSLRGRNDDRIRLERFELAAPVGAITAKGEIDTAGSTVALDWTADLPPDSPAKAFLPEGVAWQRALLAGSVRGPFERPVLALNGDLAALRLGNPQVEQLLGEAVTLAAEGTLDVPTGTFTLANSALRGAFGEAAAKGTAGARGTDLNVTFATDLERVAPLAGAPLDGDVRALATIRQTPDTPLTIGLGAVVADPRTGQAAADAALGGRLDLVGQVVMQPDGAMVFDQVQIDAAQIDATAEGRFAEGRLDMRTTARLPRLEALPLGTDLAGAVTAEGTLKGPVAALAADLAVRSPRLTVAGRRFDDVDATLALPNIAAPDGRLKADARHQGLPIRAETRFARAETGTRLRDLSLALGRNRASGALMIGDSGLIDGTLTGRFDELGQLAGLAGVELGGSARVEARFTPAAGKQNLRFDVTGGRLAVAGNTVDRLSANGTLRDVLGKPAGRVELTAGGALLGGQRFDRVNARVDGGLDAADFSLTASGDLARIVARGRMAQERGATLVALAEGQVAARGETLRLTQPARIAIGPEGRVAVTDLAARLRDGRLAGTVAVADGIQGRLTLENIPLALAEAFGGPKGLRGRIGGTASFAGDPAAPTADLALRFTGVSAPATQGAGVAGVNGTLDGRWRNGQLSADFRARAQEGGVDLTGQASMPLAAEGGLPAFRTDVPLSGRVRGTVELSRFNNLLAARGDRVGGDVALDIALGGSVAAPNFGGEVVLAGGRFESPATGLDLRNVTARLVGDGSTLRVAQLSGATPNGGTLGGSGSIRLAPGEPVADLRLTGRNALLARTDLADVTGDLDIAVRGPVSTAAITGAVNLDQVNIRVPETLPPQVVDLPVRERGKPRPVAKDSAAAAAGDAAAGGPTLDVRVVADNRIYIRGRGINAEFSGALTVRGDVGSPRPEGGISLRRGTLDLLGQRLTFTRGEITLTGGREIDPVLDLIASATGADVTVQANVTGRVSAPDVALSSQPPLPQDEILARLLFGEAVAELSPAQAIQVAQIAAQLAGFGGGGEGLLGNLRDALGVDRLDVTGIGESGGGGVGLSAGRYLSDNVYVGVEQGLGSGETRAKVEIEVSPSITVETDFGNTGQSRAGVKYRIDY